MCFFLTLVAGVDGYGFPDVGDGGVIRVRGGELRGYDRCLRDSPPVCDGCIKLVCSLVVKYGRGLYLVSVEVVVVGKEGFFFGLVACVEGDALYNRVGDVCYYAGVCIGAECL